MPPISPAGIRPPVIRSNGCCNCVRARFQLADGHPELAIPALEGMLVAAGESPAGQLSATWLQASQLLAVTYESRGEWDKASARWDAAARRQPGRTDVVSAAVNAHLRAGRYEDALARIDDLERVAPPLSPELLVRRLQSHLAVQVRRSPGQQDWTEFERTSSGCTSRGRRSPRVGVRRSRLSAGQVGRPSRCPEAVAGG